MSFCFTLYSVFKVQSFRLIKIRISIVISNYSNLDSNYHISFKKYGGLKWTRTTDLTLIRRAL